MRASSTMRKMLCFLQAVRRDLQDAWLMTVPSRARTISAIRATQPVSLAVFTCSEIVVAGWVGMMNGGFPFASGRTKSRTEL